VNRESGVTLIELIIALAIIALALFHAVEIVVSTNRLRQQSREFGVAREIAAGEIEALKARASARGLSAAPDSPSFPETLSGYITAHPVSPTARLTQGKIARACVDRNPQLFDVSITVTWGTGPGGIPHSYTTRALISR
jgi:prepilin-type N-terminal cleavage/methylation domain-containing protein